jgi:regulator of protease activity HflC (stomatin/prohibitin superfamily)
MGRFFGNEGRPTIPRGSRSPRDSVPTLGVRFVYARHPNWLTGAELSAAITARRERLVFLSLALIPVYVIVLILLASSIKILREYERAVVFRLGRFQAVKGPGLILILPLVQQVVRVDLRTVVMEVPGQDVISRDNVSLKVDAILYFRVVDAQRAIIQVENFLSATNMLAQTTLRSVLGEHELDEVLAKRTEINAAVQSTLDVQTESWGIKVISVEIREVTLTENMIRSIAKQAEAERDRRAKVIHADAEFQAAQTLLDAARILAEDPAAMQLRYLQTLTEVGGEQNSTIVFPMPIDLIKPFLQIMQNHATSTSLASNGAKAPARSTPF